MKRSHRAWIVVGGLALALFAGVVGYGLIVIDGLRRYNPNGLFWNGGHIDQVGDYGLPSRERFRVTVNGADRIDFEFIAEDGRKMAANDIHPSATGKWRIYLDSRNWIWLSSDDTGAYVWTTYTTGEWQGKAVRGNKELEQAAPEGFAGR